MNPPTDFDKIKISTKTIVATTNVSIKIDELFQTLPVYDPTTEFKNRMNAIDTYTIKWVATYEKVCRERSNMTGIPDDDIIPHPKIFFEWVDLVKDRLSRDELYLINEYMNSKLLTNVTKQAELNQYFIDNDISDGTIVRLEYENQIRGTKIKRKKNNTNANKKGRKYFRNAITVVMYVDHKFINFKIPRQGKIQMTGIKKDEHAFQCLKYIWGYIEANPNLYTLQDKDLFITVRIVMTNIDFHLGFVINRENLDRFRKLPSY